MPGGPSATDGGIRRACSPLQWLGVLGYVILDRLLVAACIAGVALAYASDGLAWPVPVGVVLPWLLLRTRQAWLGLVLVAINVALAVHRGLDQRGLIAIGLAWTALGVIWLHDRRWLPQVLGGLLACWPIAVAAILLSSRTFGIPEPATVVSGSPWALAGGVIVALLLGLACRDAETLERLQSLGADTTISMLLDPDALQDALAQQFTTGGVDVVLDYLYGHPTETLLAAIAASYKGAKPIRYVLVGSTTTSKFEGAVAEVVVGGDHCPTFC